MELRELLRASVAEYGVSLSDAQCDAFLLYGDLLREWNEKINLTAITKEDEVIVKHFADSLSLQPYLPTDGAFSLIDVGTGAGFPGIPLKIANPSMQLTLLDSLDKRIQFLKHVLGAVGADGYTCLHSRAEDAGKNPLYREQFDVCTARAVAKLPVLLEYCLPFVKVGGMFLAMKGSDLEELKDAGNALKLLGGEIMDCKTFKLYGGEMQRTIVLVKKVRQTSTKFPRKAGKPTKEPL